jgi:hypothetical protein
MMRKMLAVAAVTGLLPAAAVAQGFGVGVGARAGTLGIGAEAAFAPTGSFALRGGIGILPVEFSRTYSDVDYTSEPTSPIANIGVDFYPGGGSLRLGAGMLFLSEPTTLGGEYTGSVNIGGQTYQGSQVGTLSGELDHGSTAPYAIVGWGRHTGSGIGLFLDLGAAFMSDPTLELTATGPIANDATFQANLEREEDEAEEAAQDYLKILPIVSIGVRIGIR